jgi:hypothetical protein
MIEKDAHRSICEALASLPLACSPSGREYRCWLDERTGELQKFTAGRFGPARKAMNLFMRTVCYDNSLSSHFKLRGLMASLEVPLDSKVMVGLRHLCGDCLNGVRPSSVKHLTPHASDRFQTAASCLARANELYRVDLDLWLWKGEGAGRSLASCHCPRPSALGAANIGGSEVAATASADLLAQSP